MDGCVAFPGARRQAAFPGGPVSRFARDGGPGRFLLVICCFLLGCARRDGVAGCRLLQAGVMAGHGLAGVFCQVVPQVPPVRDLGRLRRAGAGALGVCAGPVPADHLRAGMRGQPRLHGCRLPVRQQVHHVRGGDVYQDGPVHVPLAQREVVDPEHLRCPGGPGSGEGLHQAKHGGRVHGDPQKQGQPGAGAPGQLQPEPGQHRRQRHAAPAVTAGHALGLLSERDRRALRLQAAEPAYLQGDQHRAAAGRAVGHHPRIPAMHPGGLLPASRAARRLCPARRRDHHRLAGVRHPVHSQPRQVREQHGDQGLLPRDFPATGSSGRPGRWHGRLIRQRGSRER